VSDYPQKRDLELLEDPALEQREWKIQRIAWFLMALFVALALLGFFGAGPLSSRVVTSSDGRFRLEYNRFERFQAPSTLHLQLRASGQSAARVWISRKFMENVKVDSIVPAAERVEMRDDGFVYTFSVPPAEPSSIVFQLETEQMGSYPVRIRVDDGPSLETPYWVYP